MPFVDSVLKLMLSHYSCINVILYKLRNLPTVAADVSVIITKDAEDI